MELNPDVKIDVPPFMATEDLMKLVNEALSKVGWTFHSNGVQYSYYNNYDLRRCVIDRTKETK